MILIVAVKTPAVLKLSLKILSFCMENKSIQRGTG